MAEVEVILGWRGRAVTDNDGDRIGKLDEIFVDRETGKPEFALVDVGPLGLRSRLVPLAGAASVGEEIRVPYSKDQIKEAPDIQLDGEPDPEKEAELYRHYGLEYERAREEQPAAGEAVKRADERTAIDTGVRGAQKESGRESDSDESSRDQEMGGDGEALRDQATGERAGAGDGERPGGRPRLKRYVVTETVEKTVPVGGAEEAAEPVRKERRVEVEPEKTER
jgi:sporulation protein YlmC with PRC-barrel domain